MSKKINLYWYKHIEGHGNFGDELNPYIIEKLSKQKIEYFDVKLIFNEKWIGLKVLIWKLLNKKISIYSFIKLLYYNFISQPEILFSIGSILQYKNLDKLIVWGSGIVKKDAEFADAKFLAVRGKLTSKRIEELGFQKPNVYGDPAILLPKIYASSKKSKYKIGIIPHYVHYDILKELSSDEIIVINLLDPIETIIDEINSCGITLSTSLHGIIVSHVYGIPSVWSRFENCNSVKLAGDDIKFKDYFSSIGLEYYEPILFHHNNIYNDVSLLSDKYLNKPDSEIISKIQKGLLSVAPFELKESYKEMV